MSEPTSSASEGRNASTEKVATSEGHHVVTTVTGNDASAPSPDIPNQSGDSSDEEDKFDGPSKEEEEEDEADRQKRMAMAKARGGRRRVSVSAEVMSAGSVTQYTPKVVPKTEEQMAAIKAAIADNFLFHADNMSAANLKTVLDSMEKIEAKEGEVSGRERGRRDGSGGRGEGAMFKRQFDKTGTPAPHPPSRAPQEPS